MNSVVTATSNAALSQFTSLPAPLTILHVTAPAAFGGLESVVYALATGHRDRGHNVHVAAVVTPSELNHSFVRRLDDAAIEVHPAFLPARAYRAERAFITRLCKILKPDVVHTHGFRSDAVDGGVARALGIPTVSTIHGFIRTTFRGRVYEWLQCRALRRFQAVVAVSRPQVTELVRAGVPEDRVHLLQNAWRNTAITGVARHTREQFGLDQDAFHIGWVGRLSREKGADVLLDAIARLQDLPVVVSIFGTGNELASLQQQAASLGCAGQIKWHGVVPNAASVFPAFDAFVLSSRTEGTPMVLFEAMAAQTPIIATAVGGVPDVVSNAEALLVPTESPTDLAKAIRAVFDDRHAAAHRARAAQQKLETAFAPEPWLDAYENLYRTLKLSRMRVHA